MKNTRTKTTVFIILAVILLFCGLIGKVIYDIAKNGYSIYGDAWQSTPEQAC